MTARFRRRRVRRATVRALLRVWFALLAATIVAGTAIVARADHASSSAGERIPLLAVPVPPPSSMEAAGRPIAAPASGTTGTIALPPAPSDAIVPTGDDGVSPARPFTLAGIGAVDRGRALECLTAAIYYEAASEPVEGQQAVAQVVLNRVRHPAFPATVCGVVYQGSAQAGCQFSFACDGAMRRPIAIGAWTRASRIAVLALNGQVFPGVGLATHYHTFAVTPAWNRGLVMTDAVGAHLFHRWKGYWGTPAAFHQRYVGGEPVPGPAVGAVATSATPVDATPAPVVTTAMPQQPTYDTRRPPPEVQSPPVAAPDRLPPASRILDKWKNSGQPIVPERAPDPNG